MCLCRVCILNHVSAYAARLALVAFVLGPFVLDALAAFQVAGCALIASAVAGNYGRVIYTANLIAERESRRKESR